MRDGAIAKAMLKDGVDVIGSDWEVQRDGVLAIPEPPERVEAIDVRLGPSEPLAQIRVGGCVADCFASPSQQFATDWSRDGRTLLFTNVDATTQSDIWMAPADGSGPPTPVLATPFNEYSGRLSPDGRWMAFTSDESGRPEVYVQRFPTAVGKVQVSKQGGSEPAWRVDGRELYYLSAGRMLTVASVATSPDFSAGESTRLFDTIIDTNLGNMHATHHMATAEGQRFLVNVSTTSQIPTTVVLNWQLAETK